MLNILCSFLTVGQWSRLVQHQVWKLSRQLLEKNIYLNIWFNHYVPPDGKTFYTPIGSNEIVSPDCWNIRKPAKCNSVKAESAVKPRLTT